MSGLIVLSDRDLIAVYKKAVEYKMENSFINILRAEIDRRGLFVVPSVH